MDSPPKDLGAEQAILGSCLVDAKALSTAQALLSDEDWYSPRHELIWAAMRAVAALGIDVDPVTVAAKLTKDGTITRAGGHVYLHELMSGLATSANITYHCSLVIDTARRRKLIEFGTRLVQRGYNPESDLDQLLDTSRTELDVLLQMGQDEQIEGVYETGDFIARFENQVHNWVVPGLIGRKDVWMILAPPGAGKTMLSRQLCWTIAAGRHPFAVERRIDPHRTLLIDLENDEGMAADESGSWWRKVEREGRTQGRSFTWSYPQGLNVNDPKHARMLDEVIGDTKPAFVALGSLYKSFARKGDWDQCASEARTVFDRLRTRHQIALWFEHHMPKASEGGHKHTPFGSSEWERWPSHGRVLERMVKDHPGSPFSFGAPFRGDRRKVECPVGFNRGRHVPWEPIWDEGEMQVQVEACA